VNFDAVPVLIAGGVWAMVVLKALRSKVTIATLALVLIIASLIFAQFADLLGIPYAGSIGLAFAGALLLFFWDKARPYT
jgi:hypothetical protein